MAKEIFVISDTHFHHENILKFKRHDGTILRNFEDTWEMDEIMVKNWNTMVRPEDKVYHLGDVYLGSQKRADNLLRRLNGHKRLILGNHDKGRDTVLQKYFDKIEVWRVFREFDVTLSHMPLHKSNLKTTYNIHGHIHYRDSPEPWMVNVGVERPYIDYAPQPIELVLKHVGKKYE
jgi:calcineurin-like phosphoesterase family protein